MASGFLSSSSANSPSAEHESVSRRAIILAPSRGGRAHKSGSAEQRSAAARKGWVTRRKNAAKG